jgi:hypothetical protein
MRKPHSHFSTASRHSQHYSSPRAAPSPTGHVGVLLAAGVALTAPLARLAEHGLGGATSRWRSQLVTQTCAARVAKARCSAATRRRRRGTPLKPAAVPVIRTWLLSRAGLRVAPVQIRQTRDESGLRAVLGAPTETRAMSPHLPPSPRLGMPQLPARRIRRPRRRHRPPRRGPPGLRPLRAVLGRARPRPYRPERVRLRLFIPVPRFRPGRARGTDARLTLESHLAPHPGHSLRMPP